MSKTYLPYEPDQQLLLPAALQEWLPDDHLAYFISDVVDQLDMSKVTARYERERRGGPPYHPRMMVKVLLYGYCVGVASSRRIAQRLHEDIAFRVLAANNTPDFRTISDFRKDNVDALSGLFVQVLALCHQAGLVKLGHVALDGTKVKANASKHKAMSYQGMKEKAAQLAAEVAELLRQAQAADDEEDRRYGKDKRGDELSGELAFRERLPLPRWRPFLDASRDAFRQVFSVKPLAIALFLGVLAWFAEGCALWLVLGGLDAPGSLGQAASIYAVATLVGAVTMLPGGLVGTEGSMVGLLGKIDLSKTQATTATFIIRVCTLWFAVVVGLLAVVYVQFHMPRKALEAAEPLTLSPDTPGQTG